MTERDIQRVLRRLQLGITGVEKNNEQILQAWQLMRPPLRIMQKAGTIKICNVSESAFLVAFRRLFGVDYRALFPEKDVTVVPDGGNGSNRG